MEEGVVVEGFEVEAVVDVDGKTRNRLNLLSFQPSICQRQMEFRCSTLQGLKRKQE